VRATTEASFGQEALARAAQAAHTKHRWYDPRPISGAWQWGGVFLPHGPGAMQALLGARREAQARPTAQPAGVEDLARGILAVTEGLVPPILSRLGVSGVALSAAILDRYRSPSGG
jgi:hypothetical protein